MVLLAVKARTPVIRWVSRFLPDQKKYNKNNQLRLLYAAPKLDLNQRPPDQQSIAVATCIPLRSLSTRAAVAIAFEVFNEGS